MAHKLLKRPVLKEAVFDLIQEAGVDVSEWIQTSRRPSKAKHNPRFCYNWSFVESGRCVVLSIRYDWLNQSGGNMRFKFNFRQEANRYRAKERQNQLVLRATLADAAVRQAAEHNLPVRLIINDGSPNILARGLDPAIWNVILYDYRSGDFELSRNSVVVRISDQFSLPKNAGRQNERPVRSPAIRNAVLARATGRCEYCGMKGFRMPDGSLYLETHHVKQLAAGGMDEVENMVALCPNHHREAHYGAASEHLAQAFSAYIGRQKQEKLAD